MTPHQKQLFDKTAKLLEISLAADQENNQIFKKHFSSDEYVFTEASALEMKEAIDKKEKAHRDYRDAWKRFVDSYP